VTADQADGAGQASSSQPDLDRDAVVPKEASTSAQPPRRATAPDGFVLVDKPIGWTSHQVVGRLRRLLGTRKIGHAGTLDPMATGLLVCGVGRATRLLSYLTQQTKTYVAQVRFGIETTTEDADGEITAARGAADLTLADLEAASPAWRGDIEQIPSAVSAIKVDGRRSYALVRQGQTPTLKARPVRIEELTWGTVTATTVDTPLAAAVPVVDAELTVVCSSGTYIRALARDLGQGVGTGAHLIGLRRLRSGASTVDHATVGPAELIAGEPVPGLAPLPIATVLGQILPIRRLDAELSRRVSHGQSLDLALDGPTLLISVDNQALAVYAPAGGQARPQTVLTGGQG
jgi:tRNA pseudouridine55 synthase